MFHGNYIVSRILAATLALAGLCSCSLMHDDLDPCAVAPDTYTTVNFVYDYNTASDDLFSSHVGALTLYVCDDDGKLILTVDRSNFAHQWALADEGFAIQFGQDEIVPGHSYSFYAVAHANPGGYDATIRRQSLSFVRNGLSDNSPLGNLLLSLPLENGSLNHYGAMVDTLWTTLQPARLEVPAAVTPREGDPQEPDRYLQATVPLMRVTNHLKVSFWQEDFKQSINPDDYELSLEFPKANHGLGIDGSIQSSGTIAYTPFALSATSRQIDGTATACLVAEFGLSRLMADGGAALVIKNKLTSEVTRIDNIERLLARGREAFAAQGWSEQEYLDREYDFALDIPLQGRMPRWVQVNVEALSWSKRVLNVEL